MIISRMGLPPAGPKIQKNHCFAFLGQTIKIVKNRSKKKNTDFKKSVHQTMFCEKRQTGNVLEIGGIVIRTFLTDVRPMKVHFTEK